jgi:CopG family transcriptional regulator/antitoxin EndoAI
VFKVKPITLRPHLSKACLCFRIRIYQIDVFLIINAIQGEVFLMARVLISMKDEFLERIDEVAENEHRSRSELIREALRTYITRRNTGGSVSAAVLNATNPASATAAPSNFSPEPDTP